MSEGEEKVPKVAVPVKEEVSSNSTFSSVNNVSSGFFNKSLIGVLLAIIAYFCIFYQASSPEINIDACGDFCDQIIKENPVITTSTVSVEKIITSVVTETAPVVTKIVTKAANSSNYQSDPEGLHSVQFVNNSEMTIMVRPDDYQMPSSDISQGVIHPEDDGIREKAVMVTLCRNSELWTLVKTIRDVEDRFNHRYHYDWVFLNEVDFTDEFIRVTSSLCSGKTKYGLIPEEHWSEPDYIDVEKFEKIRDEMFDKEVLYGESISYRHMCRFQSGFLFRHPMLAEYDYYWRVDSDINIFCNLPYDIFKFMRINKKKYGFILSLTEYETTIPTLWGHIKNFTSIHPEYLHENNLMDFISDDDGETFNGCHFWSNFEVADLNFFRSQAYTDYFDYLDKTGNFFYERWGDAPIHSIAATLFLDSSEVHFFDGLGFYHPDFLSCPTEENIRIQNQCSCEPERDVTWWSFYFCTRQYFRVGGLELPPDVIPF